MGPEHYSDHPEEGRHTRERWEDEPDDGPEASTPGSSLMHVESEDEGDERPLPLPVWLRESSKSFHWRWVPARIRHTVRAVAKWTKGPDPPQIQKINPYFANMQEFLPKLIDTHLPNRRHKALLLGFFYFCWVLTFSLILNKSAQAGQIQGYGQPQSIWCGATFWEKDNGCDLNGNGCRPFDGASLAFRCPANCKATHVLNPRAVGRQEPNYQPFVIGGPTAADANSTTPQTVYRADSFICQAAIHSGVVENEGGGCGVALLAGEQNSFSSTRRHGIQSIGFDAAFPKSFTFVKGLSSDCVRDLRWPLLAVTCGFTTILSLCTISPAVFFPSVFTMLFFHVGLVSDPPNHSSYPSLISLAIGRFLPAAFCAYVIYRIAFKPQQTGLTATIERTILWLGGAWVGALNNYTLDFIPIQRLTPHDLNLQKGAYFALACVVLLILGIAVGQAWYLRLEGRFRKYITIYLTMAVGLVLCILVPGLHLRIHHYFLALLLLPGTRLQTRPSLLYQGILVGLFLNGIARWGFDSILQTTGDLRGDGHFDSMLPNITMPVLGTSNISFTWDKPPRPFDGLSVLVNDVERHRWYYGEGDPEVTFERRVEGVNEYFRFGYMHGSSAADFTKAGVWERDGSWLEMEEGASK